MCMGRVSGRMRRHGCTAPAARAPTRHEERVHSRSACSGRAGKRGLTTNWFARGSAPPAQCHRRRHRRHRPPHRHWRRSRCSASGSCSQRLRVRCSTQPALPTTQQARPRSLGRVCPLLPPVPSARKPSRKRLCGDSRRDVPSRGGRLHSQHERGSPFIGRSHTTASRRRQSARPTPWHRPCRRTDSRATSGLHLPVAVKLAPLRRPRYSPPVPPGQSISGTA